MKEDTKVSMPYTGEPSFLLQEEALHHPGALEVSMPYTGEPSFLQNERRKKKSRKWCVNTLTGEPSFLRDY